MHSSKDTRRSSRVPVAVPVLVTSLNPATHFSEICETLVVNAHGCALRSPVKLDPGAALHLHSKEGRETLAKVVDCRPIDNQRDWMLAARLDRPENFWGLKSCPEDWMHLLNLPEPGQRKLLRKLMTMNSEAGDDQILEVSPGSRDVLDRLEKQLSDEHLRALISEVVQPLKGVVTNLREKLSTGEHKRSKFEVSLSQIPPELEEKLWVRLRQDLGPQLVNQTREQSEQILSGARETIDKKLTETRDEFRQHLVKELQTVEQRVEGISAGLADTLRQHLRTGVEEIQQRSTEAGNRLSREGEDLFRNLQQHLEDEHDAHCRQMRQIQAEFAAESSRLQGLVSDLTGRIAQLDDSTHRLESDLERRLGQMASETVTTARNQLENAVETVLQELGTRNARELDRQLERACNHLTQAQKESEGTMAESLNRQVAEALESFERTVEDVAHHSVSRWRVALANRLNSLARILGEQFPQESGHEN